MKIAILFCLLGTILFFVSLTSSIKQANTVEERDGCITEEEKSQIAKTYGCASSCVRCKQLSSIKALNLIDRFCWTDGSHSCGGKKGCVNAGRCSTTVRSLEYNLASTTTDSYVSVPEDPIHNPWDDTSKLTVSAWIYPSSADWQTIPLTIVDKWTYSTDGQWIFEIRRDFQSNKNVAVVIIADSLTDPGNNYVATQNNVIRPNVWQHVVFVYDGSGGSNLDIVKIYVNGVEVTGSSDTADFTGGSIPSSIQDGNAPVSIGSITGTLDNGRPFHGYIDEVSIWGAALSSTEVRRLYNKGVPSFLGGQQHLVGWWRMGEGISGTSNVVPDLSAGKHNGLIVGGSLDISTNVP